MVHSNRDEENSNLIFQGFNFTTLVHCFKQMCDALKPIPKIGARYQLEPNHNAT